MYPFRNLVIRYIMLPTVLVVSQFFKMIAAFLIKPQGIEGEPSKMSTSGLRMTEERSFRHHC